MAVESDISRGRFSAQSSGSISQFLRFAFVGVVQNGVNLGTFAILIALGVPFLLGSVVAAAVALALSFALNRRWTFSGKSDRVGRRMVKYALIWISVLLLGLPLLAVLVDVGHVEKILAQALVVAIGAPVSYAAQRRWTFS